MLMLRMWLLKRKKRKAARKFTAAMAVINAAGWSVVKIETVGGSDYIRYRDGSLRKLGNSPGGKK